MRHKGRTAVGVFAACMGAALLTTGFMLRCGVEYIIEFQFEKVLRSDVDLAFKDEHGWDALQEVRYLPGVEYAEPLLEVACDFYNGPHHRKGAITGLIPDGTPDNSARSLGPAGADSRGRTDDDAQNGRPVGSERRRHRAN